MALTRAAMFMGGGLAILTIFLVAGIEPRSVSDPGGLRSPLVMFIALMFSIGITATTGAAIGFRLLEAGRTISTIRILALGAIFGALTHIFYLQLLETLGVYGGAVVLLSVAAVMAFFGGRTLGRRASQPP